MGSAFRLLANPLNRVRQSAKRHGVPPYFGQGNSSDPDLTGAHSQLVVLLAVTTGLRRSELFGLQWGNLSVREQNSIRRSTYLGAIGNFKTETSRKPVPIDERVADELWPRKETTKIHAAGWSGIADSV